MTVQTIKSYDESECRTSMEVLIDGRRLFGVSDGEPEDNNLNRNFSACWLVPQLMELAFEAGKAGGGFRILPTISHNE